MSEAIQPGAYVRARGGMYAGATGRVLRIGQSASGPFASVDVGETHPIAVFVAGLDLVGETSFPSSSEADAEARAMGWDPAAMRAEGGALACALLETRRMREGLEALSAAVTERVAELEASGFDDAVTFAHAEMSEVAEALRVILSGGER